jgi:hypothetical protein
MSTESIPSTILKLLSHFDFRSEVFAWLLKKWVSITILSYG